MKVLCRFSLQSPYRKMYQAPPLPPFPFANLHPFLLLLPPPCIPKRTGQTQLGILSYIGLSATIQIGGHDHETRQRHAQKERSFKIAALPRHLCVPSPLLCISRGCSLSAAGGQRARTVPSPRGLPYEVPFPAPSVAPTLKYLNDNYKHTTFH